MIIERKNMVGLLDDAENTMTRQSPFGYDFRQLTDSEWLTIIRSRKKKQTNVKVRRAEDYLSKQAAAKELNLEKDNFFFLQVNDDKLARLVANSQPS